MIRIVSLVFAAISAFALAACSVTPIHMQVEPALAPHRLAVSVTGSTFSEKGLLRFGDYAVTSIKRGFIRTTTSKLFDSERTRSEQDHDFVFMARGTTSAHVSCRTVYAEDATVLRKSARISEPRNDLRCEFSTDGTKRGSLTLSDRTGNYSGRMSHAGVEVDIVSDHHIEGSRFESYDPVGYLLRVNGALIAAVQTMGAWSVWMAASIPAAQQDAAALAAATLLLYSPLED